MPRSVSRLVPVALAAAALLFLLTGLLAVGWTLAALAAVVAAVAALAPAGRAPAAPPAEPAAEQPADLVTTLTL